MRYFFAPCRPNPIILDKLANLSNVQILGVTTIDDLEFVILKTREMATIALDLSSGFLYPFGNRWNLLHKDAKLMRDGIMDGEDVGEIVKCSFALGRDEGQKRLRTVLGVPTDCKVLILSGGGIRLKDTSGNKVPIFSLLEGRIVRVDYNTIVRKSNSFSSRNFLSVQGEEYFSARRFIDEETRSQGLFETIVSSAMNDDEGSVGSVRDRVNLKTIEQEMHHRYELTR